ncbi:MAG: isoprenylcysteine carboxylmethyltransferase family protein, partial [Fimbriimonadales bacterium]|nr:isoprenylcysteine carboxylmethyltransferase family protein [Fimbriimonadales bacterium]
TAKSRAPAGRWGTSLYARTHASSAIDCWRRCWSSWNTCTERPIVMVVYLWVLAQGLLFVAYAYTLAATAGGEWGAWRWLGAPLTLVGAAVALPAVVAHGRKLTPLPEPNRALGLQQSGVYAYIRHPMYTGLLLIAFGLAIALQKPWGVAGALALTVFFNLKAREEERRLLLCYPEYAAYQVRTGRFLPKWRY